LILSERHDIVTIEAHSESGETSDQGFIWFGSEPMIEIRDCGIDVTEGDVDVGDGDEKKEVVREGGGGGVVGEAEHGGVVDREVVITVVVVTVAFKDEIEQEENNYGDDVCPKVL